MKPLYTLLLCLPAALALMACGCGVALLWPLKTQPAEHPMVDRRWGKRSAAKGSKTGWGTIQTSGRSGMPYRFHNTHKVHMRQS